MRRGAITVGSMLFFSGFILVIFLIMQPYYVLKYGEQIAVLFPKGIIGLEERNLLLVIQLLMLLVIVPVYILTFVFCWKYRARASNDNYDPHLVDNVYAEYIWWGLPFLMTAIIAVITWKKTHELDPFKPLVSSEKPLRIQVVALQWKWLFIYPEERLALVNYLEIPVGRPIRFEITADAPMNSFWIPHLGGQIYAMPKMRTELNLIADEAGVFRGSSANISGDGFADMYFTVKASSPEEYAAWVDKTQATSKALDRKGYEHLALPSLQNPTDTFRLEDDALFNHILMKFMHPPTASEA